MRIFWVLCVGVLLITARVVQAANPPQAEAGPVVSAPRAFDTVLGAVMVQGSANPPGFRRYEVAFAYDPNPTNTWFTFAESDQPVTEGVLAVWDTTAIADGVYALRVRVFRAEGALAEQIIPGLRVQNIEPTAPPPPTPTPILLPATPTPITELLPRPTNSALIVLPPTSTPRPTTPAVLGVRPEAPLPNFAFPLAEVLTGALQGAGLALLALAGVGTYAALRHWWRRPR